MIGITVFFIVLGIIIRYGKMYFLIAGYNTKPKEERAKFNTDGIATIFRNSMFGMAIIMIIGYFLVNCLNNPDIENVTFFGAILIGIPYLVIKSNSDKFKIK